MRGTRQQLRLGIEAGLALVHVQNTEYSPLPPLVIYNSSTPRYRTESISQNTAGIQVSLNATYLPARIIGLELALWGNINPVQPMIGLEGNFLIGRLKGSRYSQRYTTFPNRLAHPYYTFNSAGALLLNRCSTLWHL